MSSFVKNSSLSSFFLLVIQAAMDATCVQAPSSEFPKSILKNEICFTYFQSAQALLPHMVNTGVFLWTLWIWKSKKRHGKPDDMEAQLCSQCPGVCLMCYWVDKSGSRTGEKDWGGGTESPTSSQLDQDCQHLRTLLPAFLLLSVSKQVLDKCSWWLCCRKSCEQKKKAHIWYCPGS